VGDAQNEARLRRLEDLEEIRAVFTRYAKALDARDFAAYAGLFAESGVLEAPLGAATGPAAIQELLEERLAGSSAPRRVAFHLIANPEIELDGDRATARVLWSYVTNGEDGFPLIFQLGHYDDVLIREKGSWRIERHAITRDLGFSPLERLPATNGDSEGGTRG
jgi:3-phenylpropionate/cinnamic acid dioxygenase small subunit